MSKIVIRRPNDLSRGPLTDSTIAEAGQQGMKLDSAR